MRDGEPKEPSAVEEVSEAERRFFAEDPALDPYDLSTLKPRPKPVRILLAFAVLVACFYLLYDFRKEFSYFFPYLIKGNTPTHLGDLDENPLREQLAAGTIPSNLYVKLSGTPNYPPFLWETLGQWGRGPGAGEHARVLVFPAQEGQKVDVVHKGSVVTLTYFPLIASYYENNFIPREHLRGTFEGRLIKAKDAPFFDPIRRFLVKNYNLFVPDDAYILLHAETPGDYWVYGVLFLFALGVIVVNLVVLKRQLLRRPKKV